MEKELDKHRFSKYFQKPNLSDARKRKDNIGVIDFDNLSVEQAIEHFKGKKYIIKTYGCQANVRDSENIAGILDMIGMSKAESLETSDLIFMNTCAIRDNAEQRVFGELGFLKQLKDNNPSLMFAVCGCMAQEEAVVNKILKQAPHVDLVFGTHNILELPALLVAALYSKDTFISVWSKVGDVVENLPSTRTSKLKAFVHVTFGCDHFCTYCIVPVTRGKERSRTIDNIVKEVEELKEKGYKEITLIGQNVNSYGIDLEDENATFVNLLSRVSETGIDRVRFTTSNPWNFNREIIEIMKKHKNIMPYIHLPIQSGSEEILRRMNRPMKMKNYLSLVDYAKKEIPGISISTDIIVGFPNETKEQFEETMKMVEHCKFDNIYCFIFSPRPGTPADKMEDTISLEEKRERLTRLNEVTKIYSKENNIKLENKILKVLVEGFSKTKAHRLTGYSPENKVVNFDGSPDLIGKIVDVKIVEARRFSLEGKLV